MEMVDVSKVLPHRFFSLVFSAVCFLFPSVLFPTTSFGASELAIRVGLTDSARVLSISSSSPFFLKLSSGQQFKVSERVTVTHRGESLLLNTRVVSVSSMSVQGGDGIYQVKILARTDAPIGQTTLEQVHGPFLIQVQTICLTDRPLIPIQPGPFHAFHDDLDCLIS